MSDSTSALWTTVIGVVILRLGSNGAFLSYLRPAMRWPLLLAGGALVVLGGAGLVQWLRGRLDDRRDIEDEDDHPHGVRTAWLLALPVAVLLAVNPAPLGASAATRASPRAVPRPATFPPLPVAANGVVALRLTDFSERALYDSSHSLSGVPVKLLGFVVHDPRLPTGFVLARFVITCCAADAFAVKIAVFAAPAPVPPDNTWVSVTGVATASTDPAVAPVAIDPTTMTVVSSPASPYE